MRHFFIILFCTIAAFPMLANAQKHTFAAYNRYKEANNNLATPSKKEHRVVFFGNSITECWVERHPSFFKETGYIGRGISGQTSYQFLLRFRQDAINLHPSILVLNAGTNDIAENTGPYDEETTFGNILSMVELAQYHKIKVILTSVLPAGQFGWNKSITDSMDKIRHLNARIEDYAKKHKIPYVDYFSALLSEDGTRLNVAYSGDGVHPNVEGYKIMEDLVQKAIKK